jgi:hypothetical protein
MDTAIRFPKLTLLLLAAFLVCSFAQGAIIGFTQKGWAPGDLSTNGSLVMAVNLGTTLDATVEGVTFRGDNDGSYTANAVTATFFGADYVDAAHPGLYDGATFPTGTNAQNLLTTAAYAYRAGGADGSVVFSGLTMGHSYRVQLLIVDDSDTSTTRTVDVFSGSGIGAPAIANVDYSSRGDDRVLLVTGTFIADRSTQSLFIRGMQPATDYAGWLNAMQLRDLGVAPSPVVFNVPGLSWPDKYLVQTLQGLVNRQGPRLMLGDSGTYADQYVQDYTWNAEWRTAYQQELGMQFQTISGLANLVQFFRSDFNGLVVYDSAIDGTRCVAMTGDTLRILRELPFTTTK